MKTFVLLASLLLQLPWVTSASAQIEKELEQGLSFALSLGGADQDLTMTGEQRFELVGLSVMIQRDLRNAFQEFTSNYSEGLSAEEKQRVEDKLASAIKKIRKNEMQQLEMVLKADQIERLKQIRFQYLRRNSGGLESIRSELDLSDQQLARIEQVGKQMIADIMEVNAGSRDLQLTPIEVTDHVMQIKTNTEKDLLSILTPAQRQKLKSLEGEEFQFQIGLPQPETENDEESENDQSEQDKDQS